MCVCPLGRQLHAASKTSLENYHTILERRCLDLYCTCGRHKIVDVGTVSFRWIMSFWYFCFLLGGKARLALLLKRKQAYQKYIIYRKIDVSNSTILYFPYVQYSCTRTHAAQGGLMQHNSWLLSGQPTVIVLRPWRNYLAVNWSEI